MLVVARWRQEEAHRAVSDELEQSERRLAQARAATTPAQRGRICCTLSALCWRALRPAHGLLIHPQHCAPHALGFARCALCIARRCLARVAHGILCVASRLFVRCTTWAHTAGATGEGARPGAIPRRGSANTKGVAGGCRAVARSGRACCVLRPHGHACCSAVRSCATQAELDQTGRAISLLQSDLRDAHAAHAADASDAASKRDHDVR